MAENGRFRVPPSATGTCEVPRMAGEVPMVIEGADAEGEHDSLSLAGRPALTGLRFHPVNDRMLN